MLQSARQNGKKGDLLSPYDLVSLRVQAQDSGFSIENDYGRLFISVLGGQCGALALIRLDRSALFHLD